jgi:hypothetical protein
MLVCHPRSRRSGQPQGITASRDVGNHRQHSPAPPGQWPHPAHVRPGGARHARNHIRHSHRAAGQVLVPRPHGAAVRGDQGTQRRVHELGLLSNRSSMMGMSTCLHGQQLDTMLTKGTNDVQLSKHADKWMLP